ncbi:type II secretion system minor pseudopilin GspK [Spongorhabdus nitratireducens]
MRVPSSNKLFKNKPFNGKQRGLALLSVLLTLTLAVLLAAGITQSLQRQTRLTQGLQNREQAWWYQISAEQLVMKVLKQDFKDDKNIIHLDQYWSKKQGNFPLEKGKLDGRIRDLQSCFNLNSLAAAGEEGTGKLQSLQILKALLDNYNIDNHNIADATRDWVYSPTEPAGPGGADDNDYLALPVPYLAGNTLMRDESEWRAVLGVTPQVIHRVMPALCTIPVAELKININTIPENQPELLAAVFLNQISVNQALDILKERPRDGWRSVEEFLAEPLLSNANTTDVSKLLTVNSHYFELDARIQVGATQTHMRSLLVRDKKDQLSVIRRRTGEI